MRTIRTALPATLALAVLLAACGGPVRRVSEPTAQLQQLTVRADGSWSAEVRLQNYSSVPMRFERMRIALRVDDVPAGELVASPALSIGPEAADVVTVTHAPPADARLRVADALAAGRSLPYSFDGTLDAAAEDRDSRSFPVKRSSSLSPAPGLPGVLR